MKKLFYLLLPALLLAPCFASEEGAGRAKLNQETGKLSIQLLLRDWEKNLPDETLKSVQILMLEAMKKAPADNVTKDAARQNSRKVFDDELGKIYDAKLKELFAAAKQPWKADQKIVPADEKQHFLRTANERYFAELFRTVRAKLVKEQKGQLFRNVYPSEEELEKFDDAKLAELLEARFREGLSSPLWEENSALVKGELVEPAIRSGREQEKMQLELAQTIDVPHELWELPEITEYLEKTVQKNVSVKLAENEKQFELFSATRNVIRQRAEVLPTERVIAAFPKNIPRMQYRNLLETHPEEHRSLEESKRTSQEVFLPTLIQKGITSSNIPASLAKQLRETEAFQKSACAEYEKRFAPLIEVRNDFAATQFKEYWPDLERGKWTPELTETEQFAASGSKEIPELRAQPKDDGKLLDETRLLMEAKIRAALADEAERLESQKSCIVDIYQQVLNEMQEKQIALNGGRSRFLSTFFAEKNITLSTVVKAYRKMVLSQCAEPLFPSVEEIIEARSRAILQTVTQEESEPKPEEEKEEPPEKEELNVAITLSGSGERVVVTIGKWTRNYPVDAVKPAEITAELKRLIGKSSAKSFKIGIYVQGKNIYYHTVAELQTVLAKEFNCPIEDALQP